MDPSKGSILAHLHWKYRFHGGCMRLWLLVVVLVVAVLTSSIVIGQSKDKGRLNPMIALHEKNLPVFGVTHPAISAGGGRGGRGGQPGANNPAAAGNAAPAAPQTPPPQPVLTEVAKETMAYKFS